MSLSQEERELVRAATIEREKAATKRALHKSNCRGDQHVWQSTVSYAWLKCAFCGALKKREGGID